MPGEQHTLVSQLDDILRGCINGERYSQSKLYEMFAPNMFVVCLRYSRNREEAEEIIQEGFMRVFKFIHQFRFEGSFEGWMRKIMVNTALRRYKNKLNMHAVPNSDTNALEDLGHEDIIAKIGNKELLKMVQLLPPAYRMVFNLYAFEGMKHREIAKQLGISEGTSKSNLFDARAILQKAVSKSLEVAKQQVNSL